MPCGPGGCRREAAAALRRLPTATDVTAFDHPGTVKSAVKHSQSQIFSCEFCDGYESIELAALASYRMLS